MSDTTIANSPMQLVTIGGTQGAVVQRLRGNPAAWVGYLSQQQSNINTISYASSPIVSVLVGGDKQVFNIHVELFASESEEIKD